MLRPQAPGADFAISANFHCGELRGLIWSKRSCGLDGQSEVLGVEIVIVLAEWAVFLRHGKGFVHYPTENIDCFSAAGLSHSQRRQAHLFKRHLVQRALGSTAATFPCLSSSGHRTTVYNRITKFVKVRVISGAAMCSKNFAWAKIIASSQALTVCSTVRAPCPLLRPICSSHLFIVIDREFFPARF